MIDLLGVWLTRISLGASARTLAGRACPVSVRRFSSAREPARSDNYSKLLAKVASGDKLDRYRNFEKSSDFVQLRSEVSNVRLFARFIEMETCCTVTHMRTRMDDDNSSKQYLNSLICKWTRVSLLLPFGTSWAYVDVWYTRDDCNFKELLFSNASEAFQNGKREVLGIVEDNYFAFP